MYVIIYSRLDSKRLKNKVLTKLFNGKTLVEQVICEAKKITSNNKIILATTNKKRDNKLCDIAIKNKINYFKGSENNVLERTIECCKKFKIDKFLRYCGDRPFIMTEEIKRYLGKDLTNIDMITTNSLEKKIDKGLTFEIINVKSLDKIYNNIKLTKFDKEHLTNFFYKNNKNFKIKTIKYSSCFYKGYNYSIDDKNDLKLINFLIEKKFNEKKNFKQIVKLYEKFATFN